MNSNETKYRWKHKSLWLGLILYWLTCVIGANFVEKHQENGCYWIFHYCIVKESNRRESYARERNVCLTECGTKILSSCFSPVSIIS